MSVKIFVDKASLHRKGEQLYKWAVQEGITVIDTSGNKTPQEYLHIANQHNPIAIVNSGGLKNAGGWSDEIVSGLPSSVKAITHYGAGYDNLGDVNRFKPKGIQVSNTPNSVAQATADTALYLILGTLRNFGQLAVNLRAGNWHKGVPLADEYDNKTLGILGLGGIGALVRDKVIGAFDFKKIQYHNRRRAPPHVEKGASYVGFDELLSTSDVILLVLPLNSSTHHILNCETLAKTKKGSIIVNIGRGPLIDEAALVKSLESGHTSSAGLDVYENEPEVHPKLLQSENTLLLPHSGTHTTVARDKMMQEVIDNLDSVIEKGKVVTLVPELR